MAKYVKRNISLAPRVSLFVVFIFIISFYFSGFVLAKGKVPQIENSQTPNVVKSKPIKIDNTTSSNNLETKISSASIPNISNSVSGINLIKNPSVEFSSSRSTPDFWYKGGYGNNARNFQYSNIKGVNDGKAIKVVISSYTNGDAKWYFEDVPVTPSRTYRFSDYYMSNVPSIIDVRYKMSDGTYKYKDLGNFVPNSSGQINSLGNVFEKVTVEFTVPENVVSVTVFHIINSVGYLVTDEFVLEDITPPVTEANLIPNSGFEQLGSGGLPLGWKKGGWGVNSKVYSYPIVSYDGSKGVGLDVTGYTSGDAKWYFNPIPSLVPGVYTYTDNFSSNIFSDITLQYQNHVGQFVYKDLVNLPPTSNSSYNTVSTDLFIPEGATNITVYHLLQGVGSLKLDNVSLKLKKELSGIFKTGAVTFRFDDAYLSQYQNAFPKLASAGFKGTFFIPSQQLFENGYSGFLNLEQLKEIKNSGNEIAGHTRTHPHLTQLTSSEQLAEIKGSKDDLTTMGLGPIKSFSYPYGEYDSNTIQIVKDSGYSDAVAVIDGYGTPISDKYQLESKQVINTTTIEEIKSYVDEALRDKKWLIFEIHEINDSGNLYSTTPDIFNQMVDYVKQKQIPVVTVDEGVQSI